LLLMQEQPPCSALQHPPCLLVRAARTCLTSYRLERERRMGRASLLCTCSDCLAAWSGASRSRCNFQKNSPQKHCQ
jgi:hypothetical protein